MASPLIRLQDVRRTYTVGETSIEVLKDIDLEISSGESVAVRGVSGSGKSTLLNILGAIDRPTSGLVEVCGERLDLADNRGYTRFRRANVGFIFQFYNLLPTLTALENVMLGPESAGITKKAARAKSQDYLSAVDLTDKAWKFPEQLSGGEQQRVAIARALAKEPPLVLADEPTGSLDEETAERVMQLLDSLRTERQLTFVVVTHNPVLSEHTERTLYLHNGRLSQI